MDTRRQELLKALAESPDKANADHVVMQLYAIYKVEKGIIEAEIVTPREAHHRMGKWLKEAYYFEMFRRHYPLPTGKIQFRDKPDIIYHGAKKIGIEITNFFKEDGGCPGSEQIQRDVRKKVVKRAEEIYLKNGRKGTSLILSFDKASPIGDQLQQQKLAERIATLAKQIDGRQTGPIGKDVFTDDIPELSFVYLFSEEYPKSSWEVRQVYDGSVLSRNKLLKIVRAKESKIRQYEPCESYWLLVVVDFIDPAQDQEIRLNSFQKINSTAFERVLVYKTCFHHVLEAK